MDQILLIERTREKHLNLLRNEYKEQYDALNKLLFIADKISQKLDLDNDYQGIVGLVMTKGVILFKSAYSIILDGNGQEAGALLRVIIEAIELIKYLTDDPKRIKEFINGKLPSAGNIAQAINGNFKKLRGCLNNTASHFGIKENSIMHLIDITRREFKTHQSPCDNVLITNINVLLSFGYFLIEASIVAVSDSVVIEDALISKLEVCRNSIVKFAPQMYG